MGFRSHETMLRESRRNESFRAISMLSSTRCTLTCGGSYLKVSPRIFLVLPYHLMARSLYDGLDLIGHLL